MAGTTYANKLGANTIVTVGALNAGSITSGFGSIDVGDDTISTTGAVSAFGDQTSTAAGTKDSLAGTIDSSGTVTLTAGGAGTSALGQFTTELSIQ